MGRLTILHLAAVGIGSMIFNMIYWNFGFLRMGTTGMTAQAYGADNEVDIKLVLGRGLLLSLVIAALIIAVSGPLFDACVYLFNVDASSVQLVGDYYHVRIWAAPATLMIYVLSGWLFGMQNAIYPLILTIGVNIVNIVVSYYCVENLGLETKGVAIGTVIAQYFGVLLISVMIYVKYSNRLRDIKWKEVLKINEILAFLKINSDIFIRTACLTFVFSFFYSQSFKLGALVLAVNVILQQFINWMSYGIDGFAFATESLVGKYKGAKNENMQMSVTMRSFVWGGVVALLYSAVFMFFGDYLASWFSKDSAALAAAHSLMIYVWIYPIIGFASYIWDGVFVGLLASKSMKNAMLLSLIIFLISYYLLPVRADGSHIWIALCVFMVARGVIQTMYFLAKGFELE